MILSLVRTRNIGFWQDPRRSNVAMTQGKQATLITGDVRPFLGTEYWDTVESLLRSENNLSSRLTLKGPRHPKHEIRVESANLISAQSWTLQGGCTLRCKRVLDCGHRCNRLCHSDRQCNAAPASEGCPQAAGVQGNLSGLRDDSGCNRREGEMSDVSDWRAVYSKETLRDQYIHEGEGENGGGCIYLGNVEKGVEEMRSVHMYCDEG